MTWMANCWPMIFEPASLLSTLTCWPFALPGNATWLMPVTTSGEITPSRIVITIMARPAVRAFRRMCMSVEVNAEGLDDRAEQQRGEERQRADEDHHADQQHDERRVIGVHRAQL